MTQIIEKSLKQRQFVENPENTSLRFTLSWIEIGMWRMLTRLLQAQQAKLDMNVFRHFDSS